MNESVDADNFKHKLWTGQTAMLRDFHLIHLMGCAILTSSGDVIAIHLITR
jgi:hypothetical protein